MRRNIACILLAALSLQLMSCGNYETMENETLAEPNYVLKEYETTKSENGYTVVNDFIVSDEATPSGLYVYYPYIEDKKKGVYYLDDMKLSGREIFSRMDELQQEARPDGTSTNTDTASNNMVANAWSTPEFALKYSSDASYGIGDQYSTFAFSYRSDSDRDMKSGNDTMADTQISAYSFALYENFKDYGGPVCKVEIYGVPQTIFKENLGKKFNADKLYNFLEKLKKDNYNSCELLATKEITKTGVYYIDYTEFKNMGEYGNYIIRYTFSDKPRYNWVNCQRVGSYDINDVSKYISWKKEHAEQMIN